MTAFIHVLDRLSAFLVVLVVMISSLVCNAFQLIANLLIGLEASQNIANLWWTLSSFFIETWCGLPVHWTGDKLPQHVESVVLLGNHSKGLDALVGAVFADRAGVGCGRIVTMLKRSLLLMPGLGWIHYLQGSIFLRRSWKDDQKAIMNRVEWIKRAQHRVWIGLYPEGTRLTDAKLRESQLFAADRGLPILKNVMLPRKRGFTNLMRLYRGTDAIYDVTLAYEGGPIMLRQAVLHGYVDTKAIHLHFRRFAIEDIPDPEDEEALYQWLLDLFVEKDRLIQFWKENGRFPGKPIFSAPNTLKHFSVFVLWFFAMMISCSFIFSFSFKTWILGLVFMLYTLNLGYSRAQIARKKVFDNIELLRNASTDPQKMNSEALKDLYKQEKSIQDEIDAIQDRELANKR